MPFNSAVFKTRALTAAIFVAVMLVGLLWNGWSFFLLFTIIHFGCWYEYNLLMQQIHPPYSSIPQPALILVATAGWTAMLYAAGPLLDSLGDLNGGPALTMLILLSGLLFLLRAQRIDLRALGLLAAGLAYISLPWSLLLHLRSGVLWTTEDGGEGGFAESLDTIGHLAGYAMPLIIIATIWLNDTMAYLVGSFIGKTPLSPISPKKTWEGTVGGILISVLLVTLGARLWIHADPGAVAPVAAVTAVAGTYGDLLESKLKRLAGVKDSGHFMPGHGGFLDRFDSLLVATPFAWILCKLVLR